MIQHYRHKTRGDDVEKCGTCARVSHMARSDYVLFVKWYGYISCVLDMKTIRLEMEDEKSEIKKATSSRFFFK